MRRVALWAGLAPFLVAALFPLVVMVITAFKHEQDLYSLRFPLWFHDPPTVKHFHLLFTQTWFATWLVNTTVVSVCVVAITLGASLPASYALARLRLPGAHTTGLLIFMTYLVPPIFLFIPLAPVIGWLGLFDTRWSLVVLYPTFTIPFCTWLMIGFFRAVPLEVEEAAWIDGCGVARGLWHVILPLSLPGIVTMAIFAFTLSMHEYLYAAVFSAPVEEKVVTVGMPTMLIRGDIYFWGALMGGALIVGVPSALAFNLVLERFVRGLTGVADAP